MWQFGILQYILPRWGLARTSVRRLPEYLKIIYMVEIRVLLLRNLTGHMSQKLSSIKKVRLKYSEKSILV